MSVQKIGPELIRPFPPKGTPSVAVTPAARALSLVLALPAARLAAVQSRVAAGFYDGAEVAEEVARRLLASGDL